MKKIVWIIILLMIIVGMIAGVVFFQSGKQENIGSNNRLSQETMQNNTNTIEENNVENNTTEVQNSQNSEKGGEETGMENANIKLTVNGKEALVKLDNNVASRDFLEMLPLTLTFEDYNTTEKIATLPSALSIEGLPSGYTPKIGDFSYYAPWGNISVFYKDFRYSNSLYKLGTIESGIEIFENMNGDFEVTIERVN